MSSARRLTRTTGILFATALLAATVVAQEPAAPAASVPWPKPYSQTQPIDPASIPPIEFDVATFKLNKSGDYEMGLSIPVGGDGLTARNRPIHDLIRYAFAKGRGGTYRISGQPSWVDEDRYDIQAKIAPEDLAAWKKLDAGQQKIVLQRFLIETLKLKFHPDETQYPFYALVIAKGGPKLKEVHQGDPLKGPDGKDVPPRTILWTSPSDLIAYACELERLADQLTGHTDRPVRNTSDLHGYYNFSLHFDGAPNSSDPNAPEVPFLRLRPDQATPSVLSAVKEIGLEMKPAKAPLDAMVIDHIERPPEN
jgi:uncharacterized protein (TIGR03435 family)